MRLWSVGLRASLLLLCLLLSGISVAEARLHRDHGHRRELQSVSRFSLADAVGPWQNFQLLVGVQFGDARVGVASLKKYLLQFGYIDPSLAPPAGTTFSDLYDNVTQNAVVMYQRSFGLPVTGRLDVATLTQMVIPRCSLPDVVNGTLKMLQHGLSSNATQHFGVRHFSTPDGNPTWAKTDFTYAINQTGLTTDVSLTDIQISIDSAFATWAAVSPLTFKRIQALDSADMLVSFSSLDHGDGYPFDGPGGTLGHGFYPDVGALHFDVAETWTVDVSKGSGDFTFDLTTVAIHEIGHLLGLSHSSDENAIMFPSVGPLVSNRKLADDDVAGIQSLYGSKSGGSGDSPLPSPSSQSGSPVSNVDASAAVASWRRIHVADFVSAAAALTLTLAATLLALVR